MNGPCLKRDDLTASTGEVDHAAVADDQLARLAVRNEVAMTKGGARFKAKGRTLKDGTEEGFA